MESRPAYDPHCYLCPGNARAGGIRNPHYSETFVFTNDFAALLPDTPTSEDTEAGLFRRQSVQGESLVLCFSPRHDLTLPEMSLEAIGRVVDMWASQSERLGRKYRWVQVFENKGPIMGCSNPHPHGQIWASSVVPNEPSKEDSRQKDYFEQHGRPLLVDYLEQELERGERIILTNDHWVLLTPYWAVWPFETMLIPRRHTLTLWQLDLEQRVGLSNILKEGLAKYDNLFEVSFPYSMGWHGAPTGAPPPPYWHLHAHFYPPLLRSATVKKFMVGYEMMAEAQRDVTAEQAASCLQTASTEHYKERRRREGTR